MASLTTTGRQYMTGGWGRAASAAGSVYDPHLDDYHRVLNLTANLDHDARYLSDRDLSFVREFLNIHGCRYFDPTKQYAYWDQCFEEMERRGLKWDHHLKMIDETAEINPAMFNPGEWHGFTSVHKLHASGLNVKIGTHPGAGNTRTFKVMVNDDSEKRRDSAIRKMYLRSKRG